MRTLISLLLLLILGLCWTDHCAADPYSGYLGLRAGMSPDSKDDHLRQYELFAVYPLPWELRGGSGWGVATQLEFAAAVLYGFEEYGFLASAGPAISVGKPGFPLDMDLGISAAFLTRDEFGPRDYNGYVQFISHLGFDYRFSRTIGVGYRFQHMSNAGMNGEQNPGVNMHMLSVNWYFAP